MTNGATSNSNQSSYTLLKTKGSAMGPGDFARIDPSDTSSTLCGLSDASVDVDTSVPLPRPRNTSPSDSPPRSNPPSGSHSE